MGDAIWDCCCSVVCSYPDELTEGVLGFCFLGTACEGVLLSWGGRKWVREGGLGVVKGSCLMSRLGVT